MLCREAALLAVLPKAYENPMGRSNPKKETSDFWWCLFNGTAQMKLSHTVSCFSQHRPEKFLWLSLGGRNEAYSHLCTTFYLSGFCFGRVEGRGEHRRFSFMRAVDLPWLRESLVPLYTIRSSFHWPPCGLKRMG